MAWPGLEISLIGSKFFLGEPLRPNSAPTLHCAHQFLLLLPSTVVPPSGPTSPHPQPPQLSTRRPPPPKSLFSCPVLSRLILNISISITGAILHLFLTFPYSTSVVFGSRNDRITFVIECTTKDFIRMSFQHLQTIPTFYFPQSCCLV